MFLTSAGRWLKTEAAKSRKLLLSLVGPRDWQNVFSISRFFFIHLTMTGIKKIVLYTEDFVISRFVRLSFDCS